MPVLNYKSYLKLPEGTLTVKFQLPLSTVYKLGMFISFWGMEGNVELVETTNQSWGGWISVQQKWRVKETWPTPVWENPDATARATSIPSSFPM